MAATSVRYGFSQRFTVPPPEAFAWAIDFRPDDLDLDKTKGKRTVEWISEDAVMMTDTLRTGNESVTKARLVRINPERLSWTNTHVSGPNLHSQFFYDIVPDGEKGSRLNFTGLRINYGRKKATMAEIAQLAKKYAEEDAHSWVMFAAAMERDLKRRK